MFFDAKVQVAPPQIGLPNEGRVTEIEMAWQVLAGLPVSPTQVMPLPVGIIRMGLNKQVVKGLIDALTEIHEKMDDPPRHDLSVAHSMAEAENVARQQSGIIRP